jgi:hypothetical protein
MVITWVLVAVITRNISDTAVHTILLLKETWQFLATFEMADIHSVFYTENRNRNLPVICNNLM